MKNQEENSQPVAASAVEERFTNSIEKVESWLEATEQLAAEKAPLVVNEIINVGLAQSALTAIIGLGLLILAVWLCFKIKKHFPDPAITGLGVVAVFFLVIFGGIIFAGGVYNFLYIWFAPRVYVLEQLQQVLSF